jgi:drug/metabolite transporter (DMT)-like permease
MRPPSFLRIVPSEPVAAALLLLGSALWGSTFPAAKEGMAVLGLLPFMAWSRITGFFVLLPLAAGIDRREWKRGLAPGALLGLLLYFAYYLQSEGLVRTTATNAGFLTGLYVVGTPLLGAVMYRRLPDRRIGAAVALATAGLALLSLRAWSFAAGDLLVLASVIFWSLQILAVGAFKERDPVVLILVELGVAAALHTMTAGFELRFDALPQTWGYLIVTGALGSGLAYFVQIIAQRRVTPSRTAIIYTGEPLFAALFSWLWLSETLDARGWVGAVLIVSAMLVAELRLQRRSVPECSSTEASL